MDDFDSPSEKKILEMKIDYQFLAILQKMTWISFYTDSTTYDQTLQHASCVHKSSSHALLNKTIIDIINDTPNFTQITLFDTISTAHLFHCNPQSQQLTWTRIP